jgi:hypothetical protein
MRAITLCAELPQSIDLLHHQQILIQQMNTWANSNGFHFVGFFKVRGVVMAAWENKEKSSFLTMDVKYHNDHGNSFFDFAEFYFVFVAIFDKKIYLETSNARSRLFLPLLHGYYRQIFPMHSIEELWQFHNESIDYLVGNGNVHLTSFPSDMLNGNTEQQQQQQQPSAFEIYHNSIACSVRKHIRSFSYFNQLRWVCCIFYQTIFWTNKTIREQVKRGRFVLPQDLPSDYEKHFVHWSPEDFKTYRNYPY